MEMSLIKDVGFPLTAALIAAVSAYFSFQPKQIDIPQHAASFEDVPALYALDHRVALYKLAQPNRRAAWCAIAAAVLSLASIIFALVPRL